MAVEGTSQGTVWSEYSRLWAFRVTYEFSSDISLYVHRYFIDAGGLMQFPGLFGIPYYQVQATAIFQNRFLLAGTQVN
jgi:hypothetical protein